MKGKISGWRPSENTLLVYLFIGALFYRLLPYFLEVIVLLITKKPVNSVLYIFLENMGILILPLLGWLLGKVVGYESKRAAISGALFMGFAGAVNSVSGMILQEKILVRLLEHVSVFYVLCVMLQLVYISLIIVAFPKRKYKVVDIAVLYGIGILGSVGMLFADGIIGLLFGFIQPSFGTNVLLRALGALIDCYVLYGAFTYLRKIVKMPEQAAIVVETQEVVELVQVESTKAEDEQSGQKKGVTTGKENLLLTVACVGIVVCVAAEVLVHREKPEERIMAVIAEEVALGAAELVQGNVEAAAAYYRNAMERKSVWEYAVGASENNEYFRNADKSDLLEVRCIYWQYNNNIRAMENCLLEENVGTDFAIELLACYAKQQGELSEQSKAIRRDIISLMIAGDTFTDNVVSVADLEGRKYKLAERLDEIENVEIYCEAAMLLAETGKDGGVDREQAESMLKIAETCPEDISLQYMAVVYGCSYKSDSASHYDRTLQAAERFISLYEGQEGITTSQIYQGRLQMVDWAMELGLYEAAMGYIEDALEIQESEALLITLAQCQNVSGKLEACHETAKRILEIAPDNYGAIYYCGVASMQSGDIDGAIEDTIRLSELVCSLEGEAQHQAEVMLYDLLQYQGFSDLTYQYMVYNRLTEEQRRRIGENLFYEAYLDAMYHCFTDKKYDVALESIEYVLSVEENLSQAQYLKGCIYFGMEDYKNAVVAYKKAVEIDKSSATAWYCLANAYDALGSYEEAYEAAVRVDSLLPDTDHLFDPYGIAIHNNKLKEQLARELGI